MDPELMHMLDGHGSHPVILTLDDGDGEPWSEPVNETSHISELWV